MNQSKVGPLQSLGGAIGQSLDGIGNLFAGTGLANEENEDILLTPDRQSNLGAGAFLSVSQQAVAGQQTGLPQAQRTQAAFDLPASLATQGERFFIVSSGNWTTSHLRFEEIDTIYLPSAFLNNKMSVFGHLAYHSFIRCDFEIQVMMNATNFQQGSIVVAAIPHYACMDDQFKPQVKISHRAILTLPHCLLNCNVNNSGAMTFPWLFTRNLKSIHNDPHDIWVLKILVWSPLMVATGTSTRVSYRVMARMKNLELHGLRPFVPQMMRVRIEPSIGAMNTSNSQSTQADNDMSLGPESFPFDATSAGGLEMMDMTKQIQTPCMNDIIVMNTTDQPAGTLLWQTLVGPESESPVYHSVHHPTNLQALSTYFNYWRGDIVYTFQVMCTKFHSGRIMVSFVPEITKPLTFEDHLSSSILLFDINGVSSTARFRVPFVSDTMYRQTNQATGLLTVWVVNELTSPDTVSHQVEIVVMVSGAQSFSFFAPSWSPQAGEDQVVESNEGSQVTEQGTLEPLKEEISSAGVVEDPRMLISNNGTFPEVKPGKRTHTVQHMNVAALMGRARMFQSSIAQQGGAGLHEIQLKFTVQNGPLRGLLRLGYMMRGTIRVLISLEHGSSNATGQTAMKIVFMPNPPPTSTGMDRMASVGMVSFDTTQTTNVKLKLPWYTNLTAINTWGGPDSIYGVLRFEWFAARAFTMRTMISFDNETQLLFPMPVQVKEGYTMGYTENRRKLVYNIFKDDGEEDDDEGKQEDEQTSSSLYEPVSDVDEEFQAQTTPTEIFPIGSLIRTPISMTFGMMHHYAVYVGGGTIIELVPEKDDPFRWMWEKSGMVQMAPLEGQWSLVGVSPAPDITIQSAFGWLGKTRYSLCGVNCERWARSCTMLPNETQDDRALARGVMISGVALVAGAVSMNFQPHCDEECVKEKKGVLSKFKFGKTAAKIVDNTQMATAVTKTMGTVADTMTKVSEQAKEVMQEVKEKLNPSVMFGKKRWVKMGARALSFILDLTSSMCELAAMVKTREPEVRGLLLAALVARFGSKLVEFVTVCTSLDLPQTSEDLEVLNLPPVQDMVSQMVDMAWDKNFDQDFQPQGGVMTLMRSVSGFGFAIKSVDSIVEFVKGLFERFLVWLKPKEKWAAGFKKMKKMGSAVAQISIKVANLQSSVPLSVADKKKLVEKARGVHKDIVELLEVISEHGDSKTGATVSMLNRLHTTVAKIIMDNATTAAPTRTEPVVCYLSGKPGSGKSITANAIAHGLCIGMGLDPDENIYAKPVGTDFWDGYAGQQVMIIDDVGQNSSGEDWENFCQVVSTAPLRLNMAALSDKGISFKTPYIVMTSNQIIPKPNTISTTAAIHRRLTLPIIVEPVSQYAKAADKSQLDLKLAKASGALKGLQCCKFTPYQFGTNRGGGMDYVTGDSVTFKQLLDEFKESYTTKQALSGHLRLMMDAIFEPQTGDTPLEATYFSNPSYVPMQYEFKDVELECEELYTKKTEKRKRMKKILAVVGVCGAVVGVLGLVTGIVAACRLSKRDKEENQRAYNPVTQQRPPTESPIQAQRHVESAQTVKGNMVRVGMKKDEKLMITGFGVFVMPHTMICVKHCVEEATKLLVADDEETHVLESHEFSTSDLGGDLVAINVISKRIRPRRNMVGLFCDEAEKTRAMTGYAVAYNPLGAVLPMTNLRSVESFTYPHPKKGEIVVPEAIKAFGVAEKGACGSAWVSAVVSTGCKILGIHVAGSETHSVCQVVTREMLEGLSQVEPHTKIMEWTDAPFKVNSAGPSKFNKTVFHNYLECEKSPAPMGHWDPRATNDPEVQIVMKHRTPLVDQPRDWHQMEKVAIVMGDTLKQQAQQVGSGPILTMNEAVMGIPGLEGLDMSTSAGLPWSQNRDPKKRKKAHLVCDPVFQDCVELLIDYMANPFAEIEKPEVYYSVHLKDETISNEKVKIGRTRFIAAAPAHLVLAARRVFGRAVSVIHGTHPDKKTAYGIAVGSDPNRVWTQIGLMRPGWKVMSMDYSNFDGSLQPWVLTSACVILAELNGHPREVGWRFAQYIAYSKQICNSSMYTMCGALPSGAPFTSVIGSLCNFLMCMYTLCKTSGTRWSNFWENFHIVTYGDDVLVFVKPGIEIDSQMVAETMKKTFGVMCTDAADKNLPPQMSTLEHVTFLKRGFRRCQTCVFLTHPVMDKTTIATMLCWKRKGSTYVELMRCVVSFMWHYGREEYEDFVITMSNLMHLIPETERNECMGVMAPYDELHRCWMDTGA